MSYEDDLIESPDTASPWLIDTHCHPTDDPSQWSDNVDLLSQKIRGAEVDKIVAMSTNSRDQPLVRLLAQSHPNKIIPCFGHHPWFVHTISLSHPPPSKEEHYSQIFGPLETGSELEEVLPTFPSPRSLQEVTQDLSENLQAFPQAMLGEVGIDRAFRIPRKRWSYEPGQSTSSKLSQHDTDGRADGNCCCGRFQEDSVAQGPLNGKPKLTKLKTPIEHQVAVVKAQVAVAVELGRNISFHSVQAAGKTMDLMKEFCMEHNGGFSRGFRDINISFHSCTMDANVVKTMQKTHPNAFIGFSTTINYRHSNHREILEASDPKRLLTESDWHSADGLATRVWQAVRLISEVQEGLSVDEAQGKRNDLATRQTENDEAESKLNGTWRRGAERLGSNWLRFTRNQASCGSDSNDN